MTHNPRHAVISVSLWISAILSIIVSSSFISNRLEADEEWMVFGEYAGFRFEFWQGLLNVGSHALMEVSTFGRLRFAYPVTEILGGSATNFIESVIGLDPMLAYGVWRVVVVIVIAGMFVGLVSVLTSKASYPTRSWAVFLSAFAMPASVIAPDRLAGFRVFPSHYGLMAVLGIVFVIVAWWLFDKNNSCQEQKTRRLAFSGLAVLGPVMVISSEFFYAIGPAIVLGRLVQILIQGKAAVGSRGRELKSLALFTGGFLLSLVAVRFLLAYFCEQSSSCYSRTKVTIGPDSFSDGAFVFLGRLPFVTHFASSYRAEAEIANFPIPIVILTTVLIAFTWFLKGPGGGANLVSTSSIDLLRTGAILFVIGAAWSFGTAFAVASTEAYVRGPLGSASSEVIQLAIGSSLILVGGGLMLIFGVLELSKRIGVKSRLAQFATVSSAPVALLILISSAWALNTNSAANENEVEDILIQREISSRVMKPDTLGNEEADRCELIVRKMSTFPKSQVHDDTVLWGLNLRYKKKYQVDFCSFETVNKALEDSGPR